MHIQSDVLWAILFGGIALISQYLPAKAGVTLGVIAAAFAAWQLGFTDLLSWQTWVVIAIFLLVVYRLFITYVVKKKGKKYSDLSPIEMQKEIEIRKQYLPELKQELNEYINQVEFLANNSDETILNKEYENVYLEASLNAKGIKKQIFAITAVLYLYKENFYRNNLPFREILDADKKLNELKTRMNGLNSFVKDKVVRTNVKGYPEGSYRAYAYVIFNRYLRNNPDTEKFVKKFYFRTNDKAMNLLRDLQNHTNKRIDELLEGAQYEL